eukprot:TRINITY_DN13274_c0_g1_i1.p1 TRINITY_DN13274_c0_g1~~TRINITY_DN13274_c0_g1_i1.p1  ORF type:complete len:199 (-),score=13.95 TRINITY_DN13274_c0_g1_i1:153-749(-)
MTDFIEEGRRKGTVLVHCMWGASRSPTAVIAYLMRYHGYTFEKGYKFVRKKRNCVFPNEGFIAQLERYEKLLKQSKGLQNSVSSEKTEEFKRESNLEEEKMISERDLGERKFNAKYRCRGCRTELFDNTQIVHPTEQSKCTSYFLDYDIPWITMDESTAKLHCPNAKCKTKLGDLNLSGIKCSCGKWIAPGFQIHKTK